MRSSESTAPVESGIVISGVRSRERGLTAKEHKTTSGGDRKVLYLVFVFSGFFLATRCGLLDLRSLIRI